MGLTNLTFFIFVIIALVAYYNVPKNIKWIVLLISSIYFLFYDDLTTSSVLFVLGILITAYTASLLVYKYKDDKKSKIFMLLGVAIILGILIYLKYTNFLLLTLKYIINFFGGNFSFEEVYRNVPLGLSYYSLIMIEYIVDVHRGLIKPQKNIFKCALFMSYFPILTSGPFIKYSDEEEQLYGGNSFKMENIFNGLIRMVWGLFKVLVISERINIVVNTIYGDIGTYTGVYAIFAILLYPLQLYTNFSGSIDIIIGVSKMFGISLPENFNAPFFSKTITELWRRWHITLGGYLRDYVFYPLMKSDFIQNIGKHAKGIFGKKISKKIMLYLSMLIMWILIGIWHNGAYHYILSSGIIQFVYMVLEDLLAPVAHKVNVKLKINDEGIVYKIYQIIRTYILFAISLTFFRASSVSEGVSILKSIFVGANGFNILNLGLDSINYIILAVCIIFLFIFDKLNIDSKFVEKINKSNVETKIVLICSFVLVVLLFGMYGIGFDASEFIYGKF